MSALIKKDDLEIWLNEEWTKRGWKPPEHERIGVSLAELIEHSTERNSTLVTPYVDLWVYIFDELTSWLLSLLSVIYTPSGDKGRLSDFERSVVMILMKVIADATAIRHLILLGYDTSAKAILRSLGEYLEALVAIVDDPLLAKEFVTTDTPEGAKAFWEKYLRGAGIRRRIKRAWRRFFRDEASYESTGLWFAGWGAGFNNELSSLLHPSFAGGMMTAMTADEGRREEHWLGVWGDRSNASVKTVLMFCSFVFPVLMLRSDFPFEGFEEYMSRALRYDEADELHRHHKGGRHVLPSLILTLCREDNRSLFFPDDDMSWLDETSPKEV